MDKQVYVTSSNYERLKSLYAGLIWAIDEEVKKKVYKDDLSWIVSDIDYRYLFAEILLLNNSNIIRAAKPKSRNSDFVFDKGGPPKFHYRKDCEYARKKFEDFKIPEEIKGKGPDKVAEFKDFAQENKDLYYSDSERFWLKVEARFFLKTKPEKVEYANSGVREFSSLSLLEMVESIDGHVYSARKFLENNPKAKKYQLASNSALKGKELSEEQKEWHYFFRKELRGMLKDYLQKREGEDFVLRKDFLESIGFESCQACGIELDF